MKKPIIYTLAAAVGLALTQGASAAVFFDNDTKGNTLVVQHVKSNGLTHLTRITVPNKVVKYNCPYSHYSNDFKVTVVQRNLTGTVLAKCKFHNLPNGTVIKSSDLLSNKYGNCLLKPGLL